MRTLHWMVLSCALAVLAPTALQAATPTEKAMANQVASQIRESGKLSNYRIGVKYVDGVAVLLGSVTDASQEQAAIAIAKSAKGVDHVVSKLEVGKTQPAASKPVVKQAAEPKTEESGLLLSMFNEDKKADSKLKKASVKPNLQKVAAQPRRQMRRPASNGMPRPFARSHMAMQAAQGQPQGGVRQASSQMVQPTNYGQAPPMGYSQGAGGGGGYESPNMPGYAWPSYSAPQNYSALTYPKQYSPSAWPYIGPFYPYPQVPLGWRKVALEWDDGWWFLDFSHHQTH